MNYGAPRVVIVMSPDVLYRDDEAIFFCPVEKIACTLRPFDFAQGARNDKRRNVIPVPKGSLREMLLSGIRSAKETRFPLTTCGNDR